MTTPSNLVTDPITKSKAKTKAVKEAKEFRFTPHISAEAFTRPKGKLSFQRSVGANLNTSLFLSSLTYALTNRFEIGTVLGNYLFSDLHRWNLTLKYNFWRSDTFLWSAGFSFFESNLANEGLDPTLQNLGLKVGINTFQILFNYLPKHSKFKYGLNYNRVVTNIIGLEDETSTFEIGALSEFGADFSYAFKQSFDFTLGMGWLREEGFSALEKVRFGFGPSVRWYRPDKLLSSPTLGVHHTPNTGDFELLFSTSFY